MTYRHVPSHWKLLAQLATLLVTALLGVYIFTIAEAPGDDARLSQIEQAMSAKHWGYALLVIGGVGFFAEMFNHFDDRERLFWLVSLCHLLLFGIMVAFGLSALVGVLTHNSKLWASVLLALYLGLMHLVYVQRRRTMPLVEVHVEPR